MEERPRTLKVDSRQFDEEPLPQRTLLHVRFRDLDGRLYRWTPRIRGGEVEKIFFKMLEVEEKNSPDGAWSDELKAAAERIPELRDFRLPVKVACGELEESPPSHMLYRLTVDILPQEEDIDAHRNRQSFRIGGCSISMESLALCVDEAGRQWDVDCEKKCEPIYDRAWDESASRIRFYLTLPATFEREMYQIGAREIAGAVRSHLRSILLDWKALRRGFEEA